MGGDCGDEGGPVETLRPCWGNVGTPSATLGGGHVHDLLGLSPDTSLNL